MSYKRTNVTRRIDFEKWELEYTMPGEDAALWTTVDLTCRHTERQALTACQASLPAGWEARSVRLIRRWSQPRYMTLAKFAALSEPAEPEVTIISKED